MTKTKKIEVDMPVKVYDRMIQQARALGLRSRADLLRFAYATQLNGNSCGC